MYTQKELFVLKVLHKLHIITLYIWTLWSRHPEALGGNTMFLGSVAVYELHRT